MAVSGGFTAPLGIQGAHRDVPCWPRLLRGELEAMEPGPSLKKAVPRRTQSSMGGECRDGSSRGSAGAPHGFPPGEGQVQLLLDREKGEGSSFSTLVASRWGFRVSCFTVGDPVWRLGVLTSWSWGPSVCSGV